MADGEALLAMRFFFYKELLGNAVYAKGKAVPWEATTGDCGVFATDDEAVAAELKILAAARKGGVVVIDEAQYDDRLKKKDLRISAPQRPPEIRLIGNQVDNPLFPKVAPNALPAGVAESVQAAVVAPAVASAAPPATAPVALAVNTPPAAPEAPPIELKTKKVKAPKVSKGV